MDPVQKLALILMPLEQCLEANKRSGRCLGATPDCARRLPHLPPGYILLQGSCHSHTCVA